MLHTVGYQAFYIFNHWCEDKHKELQRDRDIRTYRAKLLRSYFNQVEDIYYRYVKEWFTPNKQEYDLIRSVLPYNLDEFNLEYEQLRDCLRTHIASVKAMRTALSAYTAQFNKKWSHFDGLKHDKTGMPTILTKSRMIMHMYHGTDYIVRVKKL